MSILSGTCLLEVLGIITALVAIVYAYFKWSYQYWKTRNVPYLEPTIPFGNFGNPLTATEPLLEKLRLLYDTAKAKGYRHVGVYQVTRPVYFVVDLELAKHIMTKDFSYFMNRGTYFNERDDPMGCHVFNVGGTKWRNLRVKLTPAFTSGKLRMMFQTLVECGEILEKHFQDNVSDKEAVDVKDLFARFTTDIIGSCAFGLDCNTFNDRNSPFRLYGRKVFEMSPLRAFKFMMATNFPNLARTLRIRLIDQEVSAFFTKVVEDAVLHREKNNVKRKDFLQLLIDLKNNKDVQESSHKGDRKCLTMAEVTAQCYVFFIAGFETSSTTATFVLYELARNQDVQDKVRDEIKTVLGKHDNQISYDSLSELTYMQQVIDETLRMYPPGSMVTRECGQDYKVPGEDVVLEKGTRVFIPIVGFHYDKDYYENPSVFDPYRFTEENKKKRHPYAHIPFGEGPRVCIGERFGIMQTKVGLTSILRNFRVTLSDKTHVPLKLSPTAFITSADGGVWLNFHKA